MFSASIEVEWPADSAEPGDWDDCSGEFGPGCQLADFSHPAPVGLAPEFAVQAQLLALWYMQSQSNHFGDDKAHELARRSFIGHAAITVECLQKYLRDRG